MKTFERSAWMAVAITLLILCVLSTCSRSNLKDRLTRQDARCAILESRWNILVSTPPRVITTIRQVMVNSGAGYQYPRPVSPPPTEKDTVCPPAINEYCEVYALSDSVQAWWEATVNGDIRRFKISQVCYPQRTTTVETIVPPLPCDTMLIADKYSTKPRNHLWLYGSPRFTPGGFGGGTVGLQWLVKDKWGLGAGLGYDFSQNTPVAEATLLFNLK
jgi:hypothetical protein